MKNLMITTAFALATAGAAVAQDSSEQTREVVQQELATYETDVDVGTLTDEQVSELYLIVTSDDSSSEKSERIEAVLQDTGTMSERDANAVTIDVDGESMARSQLEQAVGQLLATYEMDVDVTTLSEEQLSQLYLLETSSEEGTSGGEGANEQQIQEILNM